MRSCHVKMCLKHNSALLCQVDTGDAEGPQLFVEPKCRLLTWCWLALPFLARIADNYKIKRYRYGISRYDSFWQNLDFQRHYS